jgi:hypothetical protein
MRSSGRSIEGEVHELMELPINYPGVDKSKMHKAYLVTNGTITDPVRVQIADRNDDNVRKNRQYAQLEVICKDSLLKSFVDAQGRFVPRDQLAAELDKTFPLDTLVQRYWLPTIRAGVALERKDPNRAIDLLKVAGTIELSALTSSGDVTILPAYVRGEAWLMLHDGNRAAAEFQKFIDHRGLVGPFTWGALARLGLARAYVFEDDTAKARAAYGDFLALWKDADPDVPILKEARAEYAKLQ